MAIAVKFVDTKTGRFTWVGVDLVASIAETPGKNGEVTIWMSNGRSFSTPAESLDQVAIDLWDERNVPGKPVLVDRISRPGAGGGPP